MEKHLSEQERPGDLMENLPKYLKVFIGEIPPNLQQWAADELEDFKDKIALIQVDDVRSYSHSFQYLYDAWYDFIHTKLGEYGFVNGSQIENTWKKRPRACFWWGIYQSAPAYYRPFYDHHCSSKHRQEQMLNLLSDIILELSQVRTV